MGRRADAARILVRRVLRDARDKNKWRKIVRFRLWMPVVLQLLLPLHGQGGLAVPGGRVDDDELAARPGPQRGRRWCTGIGG